jgi:hypothetical protein
MSASYVMLFYPDADRIDKYEIIDDFMGDKDFFHWENKYVNKEMVERENQLKIDYKRLFTPTTYDLKYIMREYIDTIKILNELRGLKTLLNEKEKGKYKRFLKLNNWNNFFKTVMLYYKSYGDVFITYRVVNDKEYGSIPVLKVIHPSKVQKVKNRKTRECEYIYKTTIYQETRLSESSLDYTTDQVDIALLFTKGKIIPFKNETPVMKDVVYMPAEVADEPTMIHMQYLKLDGEEYSVIPALDFIDSILRLHRCETNISEINDKSGSNQIICIDGNFDSRSTFGPRSIAYADTTPDAALRGSQCKVMQLEITNGLVSLYEEKNGVIEGLFTSANLIPPTLKKVFAQSDSSKIVKFLSMDLINEQRVAYEDFCEKIKPIFKILFPHRVDEDITFDIPMDLGINSLLDKTTYVNGNTMLIRDILREQGKTEEEIDIFMKELAEQKSILEGNGISAVPVINESAIQTNIDLKPDGTTVEKRNTDPDIEKPEGIDNKDKTAVK